VNDIPRLVARQADGLLLSASGSWTVAQADALEKLFDENESRLAGVDSLRIDISDVTALDTLGAWLFEKMARSCRGTEQHVSFSGLEGSKAALIQELRERNRGPAAIAPSRWRVTEWLEALGRSTYASKDDVTDFLNMLGTFCAALGRLIRRPAAFRLTSSVYQLHRVGWQAIPIVALITFLIGGIIAQQGIFHFRRFGAESYVVDLVGILILREIGVLIVAIMVAGRSGSAYTAEIGAMKMREEIDALATMGLDPVEVLIVPRILALVVALPILTFLGSLAALYGGGLVAWFYGGMSPAIFIARLHEAVSVTHFEVGIIKAPFMALVIGLVAAMEGLRVKGSAESLGSQTTASVVKSIFLVIVLDGLFAVFFASIGM
jgi:phospholipid/cholesterol/gamma-HCH transport system permease protein